MWGPSCQTSLENEPKTRKTQIQGEIGVKKRPNWGSKTNPNELSSGRLFGEGNAQNQQTNPTNPRNEAKNPFSFNEILEGFWGFNRAAMVLRRSFTIFSRGSVRTLVPLSCYLCRRVILTFDN